MVHALVIWILLLASVVYAEAALERCDVEACGGVNVVTIRAMVAPDGSINCVCGMARRRVLLPPPSPAPTPRS